MSKMQQRDKGKNNRSDHKSHHKKYGFILVLYLFRDISLFKQKKVVTLSCHVQASFINPKR